MPISSTGAATAWPLALRLLLFRCICIASYAQLHVSSQLNIHVATIPAHGHYMTTKGLALALAARGHNVTWVLCDRSRVDYDHDSMAEKGLGFISAGPCAVYDQREAVLASVIRSASAQSSPEAKGAAGQAPTPARHAVAGPAAPAGGLAATRAMLDGMVQLAYEMCEVLMQYYAADPAGRLPDVIVFDADTYCAADIGAVWRVPRVARVGTGPRDPYTTPWTVPAYLSGISADDSLSFRLSNALSLSVSRYLVSPWLLPRLYSRHRGHWLAQYGQDGLQAAKARAEARRQRLFIPSQPGIVCLPPCPQDASSSPELLISPSCQCKDETWMPADIPWDGVPTLFNSHWGLEYPRSLRPFEYMIGHTNDFSHDSNLTLPHALGTWLGASDVRVVYVGLGTLSILPVEWLQALGEAMSSSKHFRFVCSVAASQQALLPPSVQLSSARAACAVEPKGSQARDEACKRVEQLASQHPRLASRYKVLHDTHQGVSGIGTVYVVPWAPQVAVLKHPSVTIFVTHGGMNGIAEGTYAQRPMLCMPLFSDQPDNCARAEDRGFGLTLTFQQLMARAGAAKAVGRWPSAVLDAQLLQLHMQPGFKEGVRAAWLHNVAAGGTEAAVRIIETTARLPYGAHLASIPVEYNLPWYSAIGLDVLAVAISVVGVLALAVACGCRTCCGGGYRQADTRGQAADKGQGNGLRQKAD